MLDGLTIRTLEISTPTNLKECFGFNTGQLINIAKSSACSLLNFVFEVLNFEVFPSAADNSNPGAGQLS